MFSYTSIRSERAEDSPDMLWQLERKRAVACIALFTRHDDVKHGQTYLPTVLLLNCHVTTEHRVVQ